MQELSKTVVEVVRQLSWTEQGALFRGYLPSVNFKDPFRLWIVQVGVIILTTQMLALLLRKLRQPKVIAEVIGGIFLGPTAFGAIDGFSELMFPQESRPFLSLVANIGLCLFLFLVGLEIDAAVVIRNARLSVTVAMAGIVLPFALGSALSVPLYNRFADENVKFTHFMLFTGVAFSITAFPVLCRILTELKLLDTTVGVVVLSAGVGNDIIGWTLLALSVALVNAGSGLMALWTLLTCVAWTLFLLFIVKPVLHWLARRTGSTRDGPTMFFMTVTVLLVFGSAFFTDIIGVHAIFGAFLAGLIVPREGGLAIALTEKLEDMVTIIFLPLYFTLSGLSTDLRLLNDAVTWAYTVAICALAYFGKMAGCTLAAKFSGFTWRESSAIGSLMSCKGLVELIVLNVGLSSGILSQRVFSMFVLEALLLTFMTTPAVSYFYPEELRVRASAEGQKFANVHDGNECGGEPERPNEEQKMNRTRFTVVLDKLEHLPGMMALTQLILPSQPLYTTEDQQVTASRENLNSIPKIKNLRASNSSNIVSINALRLIELSDRTSAVMKSSNADHLAATDPLLDIFGTFSALHGIRVRSSLSIVPFNDLGACVSDHAQSTNSQLVLVPWVPPYAAISTGAASSAQDHPSGSSNIPLTAHAHNPFDALFRGPSSVAEERAVPLSLSLAHSQFVRSLFAASKTDVALFVDRRQPGRGHELGGMLRLFVPFVGGLDDRLALEFAVQLCASPQTSATVVRVSRCDAELERDGRETKTKEKERDKARGGCADAVGEAHAPENASPTSDPAFPDTVYSHATTQTRLQSDAADDIAWAWYTRPSDPQLASALSRMEFAEISTSSPLRHLAERARHLSEAAADDGSRLLVLAGRSRRPGAADHRVELRRVLEAHGDVGGEVRKTVGDVAAALVVSGCQASMIVFQGALSSE